MKKNTMMRIASVLMIAVLITTCVISATFAKYTTSTTGNDNARVAYWGFEAPATFDFELFANEYDGTVVSADDENVVAPGTAKSASFAFLYTPYAANSAITAPEVDYVFTVDCAATGEYGALDRNTNFYWTLDGAGNYQTVAELIAAVELLAGEADGSAEYGAGDLPTAFTAGSSHTIGWAWNFGTGDVAADEADTIMGNADALDNVTITITITATQIGD